MDPFAILGIAPRFEHDTVEVEKRYRELSRALHPDRYVGRPASERRMALSRAIEVNEAWRLVRDPVKKAEALLRRAGIEVGENKEPGASPQLLMEMMDRREALAEARANKDAGSIKSLTEEMKRRQDAIIAKLRDGFDAIDGSVHRGKAIVPMLGELRYVRRFLDEASAAEDELP